MPETCDPLNCCPGDSSFDYQVAGTSQLLVTISITPEGVSESEGAGLYDLGDEVTVAVEAAEGYTFVGWFNSGGALVSENLSYTFNLYNNQILEARFEPE